MKKLTAGILATLVGLGCFTACNGNKPDNSSSTPTTNVDAVKEMVFSMYEEKTVTRQDYVLINSYVMSEHTYTIEWAVDVTEGVTLTKGETTTTVDVNEELDADLAYVLTATISDGLGNSTTLTLDGTVLQAPVMVSAPISTTPVEGTEYKLYMYQKNKAQDLYFTGAMKGYYGATSQDAEEAVALYVEYAEGSETDFYIYFTDAEAKKQYISVTVSGTHINFGFGETAMTKFVYSTELQTFITVESFEKSGKSEQCYLGTYGTNVTYGPSQLSYAPTSYVGRLVTLINREEVSDTFRVEQETKYVSVPAAFIGTTDYELTTKGTTFPSVGVTWKVEGTGATIENNVLKVAAGTETTTVTVTATVASGEAKQELPFEVVIVPNDTAAILAAAKTLENGEKFGNKATFTGVVTSIDDAYSEQYGNVTLTIQVGEEKVQCFRLVGTAEASAETVAAGYTVTVTGILEIYKDNVQFGQGCEMTSSIYGEPPASDDTPAANNVVATFTFGENGDAAHVDGNDLGATASYTDGSYTLALTGMSKVYGPAFDAKGNSCIKLGTSSKVGTFSFTVADDVDQVIIKVAQYKANATKIKVNGVEYTISTASNNGEYTEIVIDTTTTKTVSFETVSGACRAMIDSIAFAKKN